MKAGWELKTLDCIAEVKGGKRVPKGYQLQLKPTNHPYITVSDFSDDGTVDSSSLRYVNSEVFEQIKRYTISSKDLYLSIAGTIGKTGRVPPELDGASLTENACKLVMRPGIHRDFIYYFTKSDDFAQQAGTNTRTAAQPKLALERLKTIKLRIPTSLPEQQRIVTLLDEAFDGIATAKAHAETNLQNARAIFESQREVLLSFKQGWHETPLAALCDVKHGFAFAGEFFAPEGDYVLLTPGSFFEAGGYREREEKTKFFVGQISNDYILDAGDLLVAMTEQAAGLLGSPLLVPESNRFLHNQRLGLVIGKTGVPWLNEFFFHVFNLGRVRQEIHGSASGVKVRHTSPGRIGAVRVAYPMSVEEQRRITLQLGDLSDECEHLESLYQRKLTALDELKKSLLAQAFSGVL